MTFKDTKHANFETAQAVQPKLEVTKNRFLGGGDVVLATEIIHFMMCTVYMYMYMYAVCMRVIIAESDIFL